MFFHCVSLKYRVLQLKMDFSFLSDKKKGQIKTYKQTRSHYTS